MTESRKFKCAFCSKSFTREVWFRRHMCDKRKRFHESHNLDTVFGLKFYDYWCSRQGFKRRGKPITMEHFVASPYYNTFVRLSAWGRDNYLITPYLYLDWIIASATPERDWFKPSTLAQYRQYIIKVDNPELQAKVSHENALSWCREKKVPVNRFFATIGPGEAVNMMAMRKLMPWVVFGYDQAVADLLSRFNDEWLQILNEKINTSHWINKISSDPDGARVIQIECQKRFENVGDAQPA